MVADYISSSRKKYAANAVPLTPEQRAAMKPFFSFEILDQTRLLVQRETVFRIQVFTPWRG